MPFKEGDKVAFIGEHDVVEVGDVGVVEKVLTEEERKRCQVWWGDGKEYKYQVNFDGTILVVSGEDVVPLPVARLLQI